MPTIPINLIKGDKLSIETDYRDALPVNMYAVKKEILGATGYMICYDGLTSFSTGEGTDRGGVYNERFEKQFRVSGQRLIEVVADGSTTVLGDIPGAKQVALANSFNTQCIVANKKMFLYSPTDGLEEVTDPDVGEIIDVVWVDQYYFCTDGEFIFHTDINSESSIDPLKYATAEFMPDKTLGVSKTEANKVMVWGRYSLEEFVDIAQDNFAFKRLETRAQKIGIVATHAKCECSGGFYITGGRKNEALAVHIIGTGTALKISTREIDKILSKYTDSDLADMRMESKVEEDVAMVLVHLPNETLCFNETVATTLGSSVAWSIIKSSNDTPYRAINGVFDPRVKSFIYGDKTNTNIGKLDSTVYSQYGVAVEWELYTPLFRTDYLSIDEINMETLPGKVVDNDSTVAFSITSDGITYGQENWQLYGTNNQYNQNFYIFRIGQVPHWCGFKFRGLTKSRMAFAALNVTLS